MGEVLTWGIFVGSLALSAFFSAAETAFSALTSQQRLALRERQPSRAAQMDALLANPQQLFLALLFGNVAVNTVASILGYHIAVQMRVPFPWLVTCLGMFVVLYIWGEVIPKSIAMQQAPSLAVASTPLLRAWLAATDWLLTQADGLAQKISTLVTPARWQKDTRAAPTEDEYLDLLEEAERLGLVAGEERTMINRILSLGRKKVADIMTPLPDVQRADDALTREQIAEQLKRIKHSRVPVAHGSADEIVGIINARDFLLFPASELDAVIELPSFVPETMNVARLLQTFQRGGHKMAIAVDEYGNTAGIVTMEDIIEAIVGEIEDEFDVRELLIQQMGENSWLLNGKARLDHINELLGTNLAAAGVDTVGGWFIAQHGALPKEGEKIQRDDLTLSAQRVGKNVIREILLERRVTSTPSKPKPSTRKRKDTAPPKPRPDKPAQGHLPFDEGDPS